MNRGELEVSIVKAVIVIAIVAGLIGVMLWMWR